MYILVLGNPIDGFEFEGLFTSKADATAYGEQHHPGIEWWIATLTLNTEYQQYTLVSHNEPVATDNVPANKCSCGHQWSLHTQNVYGIYVCGQCNCRGMQPPKGFASEIPN